MYHPFICGPKNENIDRLIQETGAKINVPPPSVMKDEIVLSGDKDGVLKCKEQIMKIYIEKVINVHIHVHIFKVYFLGF